MTYQRILILVIIYLFGVATPYAYRGYTIDPYQNSKLDGAGSINTSQ